MSRLNEKVVRNFLRVAAVAFALGVEAVPAWAEVPEPREPSGEVGRSPAGDEPSAASVKALPLPQGREDA